jgi:hypothetical protein
MRMWQAERLPYKDASNSWQGGRLPYKGKRGDNSCVCDRVRLVTVKGFDQKIRRASATIGRWFRDCITCSWVLDTNREPS